MKTSCLRLKIVELTSLQVSMLTIRVILTYLDSACFTRIYNYTIKELKVGHGAKMVIKCEANFVFTLSWRGDSQLTLYRVRVHCES